MIERLEIIGWLTASARGDAERSEVSS